MYLISIRNFLVVLLIIFPSIVFTDLNKARTTVVDGIQSGIASQEKINSWDDETKQMLAKYQDFSKRNKILNGYMRQLNHLIEDQQREIHQKQQEITLVKTFERYILPLLERMIEGLDKFVKKDLPFLSEQRQQSIVRLNKLLTKADVPVSEKFRQVIAAYQAESDYGYNIETYQDVIQLAAEDEQLVDFLRIGRNLLMYQSLDGSNNALWDTKAQAWHQLDNSWQQNIRYAIRIAQKRIAPDLLVLPMPAVSSE